MYRCEVSKLLPEGNVGELLHALGSDHQALVQEPSDEVRCQQTDPTAQTEVVYNQ